MTRRRIASAAHVSGVASPEGAPCFALRRRIGADLVAKSQSDGYTLLMAGGSFGIISSLYRQTCPGGLSLMRRSDAVDWFVTLFATSWRAVPLPPHRCLQSSSHC